MGLLDGIQSAFNSGVDSIMGKSSQATSSPVQIPGIIGQPEAAGYLRTATGMTGQDLRNQGLLDSLIKSPSTTSYTAPLQTSILNPNFGPQTTADQNMINQIINQRQGSFNALGIGASPASQSAVAASAAPTLSALHQQVVGNLQTAENSAQAVNQARMSAVLQSLQQELSKRGIDINALLQAAAEGKPQVANESQSTGETPGFLQTLTNSFANLTGSAGQAGMAKTIMK